MSIPIDAPRDTAFHDEAMRVMAAARVVGKQRRQVIRLRRQQPRTVTRYVIHTTEKIEDVGPWARGDSRGW